MDLYRSTGLQSLREDKRGGGWVEKGSTKGNQVSLARIHFSHIQQENHQMLGSGVESGS